MSLEKENKIILPIVYGQAIVEGLKIFEHYTYVSKHESYWTMVYVLAEGQINTINQVQLNEMDLFVSGSDFKSGTVGSDKINYSFRNHVQVQVHDGSEDGFRFEMVEQNSGSKWKETALLKGRAAIAIKCRIEKKKSTIQDENVELRAKIEGKTVVDFRTESLEPTYRFDNGEVVGNNPALCIINYLTDKRYGCGYDIDEIDFYSFIEAANWCDVNEIRCNGAVNQSQNRKDNITLLLNSFRAKLTITNGQIKCLLDTPQVSEEDFYLDDTINKITINQESRKKRFNQLEVDYETLSFTNTNESVLYPPTLDDPIILADGRVIKEGMKLPFTKSQAEVDFLASMFVRENLPWTYINFEVVQKGFSIGVGSVFTITLDDEKWVKKKFRCISHSSDPFGSNPNIVKIEAVEYLTEMYDEEWNGLIVSKADLEDVIAPKNLQFSFVDGKFGLTGELKWDNLGSIYDSQVMYKLSAQPDSEFQFYAQTDGDNILVTGLKSALYDFYVVNRDLYNRSSVITYLRNVDAKDETVLPKITGLTVNAETQDFIFNWDDMLGAQVSSSIDASSSGDVKVQDVFSGYEIEIIAGGQVVETQTISSNQFIYTFSNNKNNGLSRNIQARVSIVAKAGARSVPVDIQAVNLQQPQLSGISVYGGLSGVSIKFLPPTNTDFKGVLIHMSKTRGFTPNSSNIYVDLINSNSLHEVLNDQSEYFIRLGAYDVFGKDLINYSAEFVASMVDVNSLLEEVSSDHLSQGLLDTITGKASTIELNNAITVANVEATQEAQRVLSEANTKTDLDINAAKVELNEAIANVEGDLLPINSKILNVERSIVDGDTALSSQIATVQAGSNTNAANISTISKAVTDNNTAVSTRIDTVQATAIQQAAQAESNAKQKATADITLERNARISADNALSSKVDTVTAKANSNSAKIIETNTTLAHLDSSVASKVTTLESSFNSKLDESDIRAAKLANHYIVEDYINVAGKGFNYYFSAIPSDDIDDIVLRISQRDLEASIAIYINDIEITQAINGLDNIKMWKQYSIASNILKSNEENKVTIAHRLNAANDWGYIYEVYLGKETASISEVLEAKAETKTFTSSKFDEAVSLINTKDAAQASKVTTLETELKTDAQTKADNARDEVYSRLGNSSNLLSKYLSNWKDGGHPKDCGFSLNGANDENRFILDDDAYGSKSTIWEMNTNSNSSNNADGGISSASFDCDSKKSYRFSIFVKRNSATGRTYLGCSQSTTDYMNGYNNGNPYFWYGSLPKLDHWYLIVGILQADSGTASSGISGLYDAETGVKVSSGTDHKIKEGATLQSLRAYFYYSNNTYSKQYFWMPRVDVINGNEPSLTSLMPKVAINAIVKAEEAKDLTTAKFDEAVNLINTKDAAQASKITSLEANVTSNKDTAKLYTDSKHSDAVNLINTKDAAQASKITSLESSVSRIDDNGENGIANDLIYNSRFTLKNDDNRPQGWYAAFSNSNPNSISFAPDGSAQLYSSNDTDIGITSTAFKIQKDTEYTIRIKVKASADCSSGFYFRINELDSELPRGKFAISSSGGESAVQSPSREFRSFRENKSITAEWQEFTFIYKPTSTAKYASAVLLNWGGMGTNKLYIDYCSITESPSRDYTNTKYDEAVALVNTKDAAQASKITSLEANVTSNKDTAKSYTDSKYTSAVSLINSKDAAQASSVRSLEVKVDNNEAKAALPFTKTITINGDANKYYPVYFMGGDQNKTRRLLIHRSFSAHAPSSWGTPTHKGGLTLDIRGNWGGWGGARYDWKIHELRQIYSKMYSGGGIGVHGMGFYVFLRGGGATYHVASEQSVDNLKISYSTSDIIYPHSNSAYQVYATAAKTAPASQAEIDERLVNQVTSANFNETVNLLADTNGRLNATWALRLAAGNKISGIGLANNGTTSTFSVLADSFKIYANGKDNAVFAVSGGKLIVKSAYIGQLDSANIKAGAIDATHLSANSIEAKHIKANQLIESPTIRGGKVELIGANFMRISSATPFGDDELVEWSGMRLMNGDSPDYNALRKSNATTYVTDTGDAYFGGNLSAGTYRSSVTNSSKAAYTNNSYPVEIGPFESKGGKKSVVVSYSLTANSFLQSSSLGFEEGGLTYLKWELQRKIGSGSWATVSSGTFAGAVNFEPAGNQGYFIYERCNGSITYTDANTSSSDFSYRVKVINQARYHGTSGISTQRISVISTEE